MAVIMAPRRPKLPRKGHADLRAQRCWFPKRIVERGALGRDGEGAEAAPEAQQEGAAGWDGADDYGDVELNDCPDAQWDETPYI